MAGPNQEEVQTFMSITGLLEAVAARKLEVSNFPLALREIFGLVCAIRGQWIHLTSKLRGFSGAIYGLMLPLRSILGAFWGIGSGSERFLVDLIVLSIKALSFASCLNP